MATPRSPKALSPASSPAGPDVPTYDTLVPAVPAEPARPAVPHEREPLEGPHDPLLTVHISADFTVGVVGLGYVGLPTALSLLDTGRRVIGLDVSAQRLNAVRGAAVDLLPDDMARLQTHLSSPDWELTGAADRLAEADAVIVCVPTPVTPELVPDLSALSAACASVVSHARPGQTIVLTSTSYVGCTRDLLVLPLLERGLVPGRDVHVAFSPERIDPGVKGHSPATTPRVVGGVTEECAKRAMAVLEPTCPLVHPVSSCEAAELTKLLENTFRAVNIAMINEFADIAGELGLPIDEVIDAAATKPYGFMRFSPGAGVGGHCIPCDPHYLLWQLRARRVTAPVIEAAMTGIATRPRRVVTRLREELAKHGRALSDAAVHIIGVAYKPGVADVRESPALEIIAACRAEGATVSFADPLVPRIGLPDGSVLDATHGPAAHADIVLVHTRHPGHDLGWLGDHPAVLDATYRLSEVPQRAVV